METNDGMTSDRVVVEETSKGVNFSSNFIYLCIFGCAGSSLLCAGFSRGCSPAAARRLVIVVASLVVVHGLSCPTACGMLPGQGSNPCPLHWPVDF